MDDLAKKTRKRDLLDAYGFRHAAKSFDGSRKIDAEDFDFLLEAARLSPSSFGMEPWNLLILQDPGFRAELRPVAWGAQGQLDTASHFVLFLVRGERALLPDSPYLGHILADIQGLAADKVKSKRVRYGDFLRDDFSIDREELFREWGARQAYIALGNMMTAAALIGIDSCPIEGFNRRAAETILAGHGLMDAGNQGLAVMAAFGYRSGEAAPKKRRPAGEILTWA